MKKTGGAICAVSIIVGIVLSYGSSSGIRTNKDGLELIGNAESCRRDPYYCPAKVLTAGIGSTTGIQRNHNYSDQEIADMWMTDLRIAEKCVNANFNGGAMNDNQFSAMTSAVFNLGCNGLMWYRDKNGVKKRTTIWRMANAGDFDGMCGRLMDFTKAGGVELKGLVIRRGKEYALCIKPIAEAHK